MEIWLLIVEIFPMSLMLKFIHVESSENFKKFLSSSNCNSIFFETCSIEEIVNFIDGFENRKSSDIPILIIKSVVICLNVITFLNLLIVIYGYGNISRCIENRLYIV